MVLLLGVMYVSSCRVDRVQSGGYLGFHARLLWFKCTAFMIALQSAILYDIHVPGSA